VRLARCSEGSSESKTEPNHFSSAGQEFCTSGGYKLVIV
jgi:hypothetical protein